MRNSRNVLSLIDRKGCVRLQEHKFLAIIRCLRSAKIVLSIKTRQEVDCFELASIWVFFSELVVFVQGQYSTTSRFQSGKEGKTTQCPNRLNHRKRPKKTQSCLAKVLPPNRFLQLFCKLHLRCLEQGLEREQLHGMSRTLTKRLSIQVPLVG